MIAEQTDDKPVESAGVTAGSVAPCVVPQNQPHSQDIQNLFQQATPSATVPQVQLRIVDEKVNDTAVNGNDYNDLTNLYNTHNS